jgi:hypothetical protein
MRAIEDYLGTLPVDQPALYSDLARVAYRTDAPSRAQLSAVSRTVGSLERAGKARRVLSGYLTDQRWVRSAGRRSYWAGGGGAGWCVRRETLVYRVSNPTQREAMRVSTPAQREALRGLPGQAAAQARVDQVPRERHDSERRGETAHVERVDITPDALKTYLDHKYGPDRRIADWSYEWAARLLKQLGFRSLADLENCIGPYDADQISRFLWGSRQGQLIRLEDVLLASMGIEFIANHPSADEDWFGERQHQFLERLTASGFHVGAYRRRRATHEHQE